MLSVTFNIFQFCWWIFPLMFQACTQLHILQKTIFTASNHDLKVPTYAIILQCLFDNVIAKEESGHLYYKNIKITVIQGVFEFSYENSL